MKETFKLPETTVPIIQVYNEDWSDWIDLDEDLPPNRSKIQVLVQENNDVEQQQEEEMSQTPTSQNPIQRCASDSDWHLNYTLPTMPADVRNLLKEDSPIVLERKWRSRIVKQLYEDVSQHTMYPTPSQYQIVCSTLVARFPVLKDRAQNSSGYDTWKESLINKFKYERSPLQSNDVLKKKEVYGHKKAAVDRNQPPSTVKRVKRDSVEKKSHVMPQPHLPKETKQHTAVRTSAAASSRASPDLSASLVTTSSSSSTPAQRFVPVNVTPAPSAPTTSEPSSVISAPSTAGGMLAGHGTTSNWSDHETRFLLKQWSSKAVQERLDGTVQDARVYQSLSEAMHRAGFPRSASQLRVKLEQCKQNYRIARLENKKKGCITVGPCYQILHSVLGEEDPILLRKLALQTGADSDVNGENFGPNMSSSGQAEFDNFPPDEDQEDDSVEESRNSFPVGIKVELPDGITYMMEKVNDLPSPPSDSMCGDSQSPPSDLNAAPSPGHPPSSSLSTLDRSLPPDPVPEFDIRDILGKHSSGRSVMHELETEDKPSTAVRHSLVRILVDHLVKNYGWYPASDVKSSLAKALVTQFPSLRDHSAEGCVYNEDWSDWIDLDQDLPPNKSKIQVLVQENNDVEQQQDEEMSQTPTSQ
ncbi:uncharacterized protein [Diadema setosum]|uniref:uncharacterized protein n=1 Tax=Diadema setosum TaxID=31175 RepID=UPI003B3B04E5